MQEQADFKGTIMWWESVSPSCPVCWAVSVHFSLLFMPREKQETKIIYILNMLISAFFFFLIWN